MISPLGCGFDADGNLVTDGRWTYTWDAENRLVVMVKRFPATDAAKAPNGTAFEKLGFQYDAQSRRIAKHYYATSESSTPFLTCLCVYDGWNLIAVLNSSHSVLQSFAWGLDLSGSMQGAGGVGGLLWLNDTANGAHFAGYDANGNVMALVNAADGIESARYEYGPFGEPIRGKGTVAEANPFRFSTKFTDNETDLLYYGYRFYSVNTGRWLSRDPIEEHAFSGFKYSRSASLKHLVAEYVFVRNAPATFVDPLGLFIFEGCTASQIAETKRQAGDRCKKARERKCYRCLNTFAQKAMRDACESKDGAGPRVKCETETSNSRCNDRPWKPGLLGWTDSDGTMHICMNRNPGCGMMHEMAHSVGGVGPDSVPGKNEEAYAIAKCAGCPTPEGRGNIEGYP